MRGSAMVVLALIVVGAAVQGVARGRSHLVEPPDHDDDSGPVSAGH